MKINPMIDRNPAKSLERAYNEAGEFQIYREIYMNSVEAGASKAGISNFHNKLAWLDDGCGIDPGDLDQLINGRNSSSKNTDGRHGNFGVGLKDAGLFPNPHGLIVVSKTEAHPKGGMIWLCIDPEFGAGAKMLISDEMRSSGYTGDGETFIDFESHDSFTIDGIDFMSVFSELRSFKRVNTGTAIILMGQDEADVTFPDVGLVRLYLQSRIYKFDLSVYGFRYEAAKLYGIGRGHSRHIISSMLINGFTVETSLYHGDDPSQLSVDDPGARGTFVEATLYKSEMYGVSFTSSRASQMKRSRDAALKYGLIYPQVYNRVNIVIKPPIYDETTGVGCFPDSSRSTLRWEDPDSQDRQSGIPYEMIQEYYRENMPEELRQMMNEIAKTETRHEQKTQTARLSRFFSKSKKSRLKLIGDGYTLMTSPTGSNEGGDLGPLFNPPESEVKDPEEDKPAPKPHKPKVKRKAKPVEPGAKKKKAMKRQGTIDPIVIFSDEDPTQAASAALLTTIGTKEASYPLAYEEHSNRLYVNSESLVITEEMVPACLQFLKDRKGSYTVEINAEQVFTYIVKPSLREALPTCITHMRSQKYLHEVGIHPRNPEHISSLLSGLWQFERFYPKHYKQFKLRAQAKVVEGDK